VARTTSSPPVRTGMKNNDMNAKVVITEIMTLMLPQSLFLR
jgi:hypothetical protein